MYYLIYKMTNMLNNKIYIGMHKTDNMNDGYRGSGKALKNAIKKYGISNFKYEVIEVLSSEEEMIKKEQEIVTEEFCSRIDTYNIMPGGLFGSKERNGLTFANRKHTDDTKRKIGAASKGRFFSEESRKKMSENNFARRDPERQKQHAIERGKQTAAKRKYAPNNETNIKVSKTLLELNKQRRENGIDHPIKGIKRQKIKCPHCNKEGALNVMKRFHLDNCKNKIQNLDCPLT
jgi:group I intron endonuclease